MSKFKILLPDSENPYKASAFGEWEDTPENRKTLADWSSMGYVETHDNYVRSWDGALYVEGHEPVKPLDMAKEEKRKEINEARNNAEQGGFEYMGKVFDSDEISCLRMSYAAQAMALMPMSENEQTITWTCKDNSTIDLTAGEMQGLISALAAWSNSCHEKATALKAQISAATTNEEVESIKWD